MTKMFSLNYKGNLKKSFCNKNNQLWFLLKPLHKEQWGKILKVVKDYEIIHDA